MSAWFLLVIAALMYVLYIMLESYRSLERELREIRLKCIGTKESDLAVADPATTIKNRLLGAFKSAAAMTASRPLPAMKEYMASPRRRA
jgi:hypothetical protein